MAAKKKTKKKAAASPKSAPKKSVATKKKASAAPKAAAKKPTKKPVAKKPAAKAGAKKAAAKPAAAKAGAKATAKRAAAQPTPKATAGAKAGAAQPTPKAKAGAKAPPARRDATGHLNPKYAKELLARSRESRDDSDDRAFFKKSRSKDDLAEELGEEAVTKMTSGEDTGDRWMDTEVEEEKGGPFVRTRGREEFARGTDKSNPRSATREPFPRT